MRRLQPPRRHRRGPPGQGRTRAALPTYPADPTIFDAVTKEGIHSVSQALLHQATDEDEFWQRDIIRLKEPNTLVRSAYTTYQWVHFERLCVEYERL